MKYIYCIHCSSVSFTLFGIFSTKAKARKFWKERLEGARGYNIHRRQLDPHVVTLSDIYPLIP